MTLLARLSDHLGKLVNPGARSDPVEFARQKHFIATRFAASFGGLALSPLALLRPGGPPWWEAGALVWLSLPFVAAVWVSRSGRRPAGELLGALAWAGLGLTFIAGGCWAGLAVLLLLAAETADGARGRGARVALSVVGAVAAGLAAWSVLGAAGVLPAAVRAGATGPFEGAILAAALVYGLVQSWLAQGLSRLRDRSLQRARARYADLADAIDALALCFDRAGSVVSATPAGERLFALPAREVIGRGLFERIHVADRPAFLRLVADGPTREGGARGRLRLRTGRTRGGQGAFAEPEFVWIDLHVSAATAMLAAGERSVTAIGIVRDAEARVRDEQAAAREAEASARSASGRDLFLANVSHELRTPLNAIIGFAEMLANETLAPQSPAKQREYAAIIHHSGQHLLAVVNSILDASKIESGQFEIVPEAFDLAELIQSSCTMVGLRAEQAGIHLIRDIAPAQGEFVGDKRACRQIMLNLLSNALKFTPARGQVTVGARAEGSSIVISVADTGIGIGARDLPRLGDPFFQARAATDHGQDGTGLGLSVVRGLVGLHGGTIAIESAPGQGTRVTVRLPRDCRRLAAPADSPRIETTARYLPQAGDPAHARVQKIA